LRIRYLEPLAGHGDGSRTLARFDFEVGDVRLNDWLLKCAADGTPLAFAPNARGRKVASLEPDLTRQIAAAAMSALTERCAQNENRK
jgi:hypothetical protein